jgi:glycosyltransferase involved in cell wall biosynthesis
VISIITPTHAPKYVYELYKSILAQTYTDWEWVILNSSGEVISIDNPKVRVIENPDKTTLIGKIKKKAFGLGKGDILVEVDHDDVLTPDCLEEVSKAFSDPEIGFVYSDNAKLTDTFVPYNKAYGWEHSKFKWEDKEYFRMHSFEPSAQSFSFIWYMPDHVRAWRKSAYDNVGGHDETLEVLDDQDLMIRTYLTTKVKFIDKCLYLYRITGDNTWIKKNEMIQTETVNIYNKYAYKIHERWSEQNNLLKVDLCGGFNKPRGYTSLDLENGDINCDLEKTWPLPDSSVGILRAHDAIEHLHDKQFTMSEAYRVLADGGLFGVLVPSTDGRGAWQDPTHVSFWNENSFWYYTDRELAKYIRNDKIRFQKYRLETIYPSEWHVRNKICYVVAYLMAIKSDKRRPHPINI